MSGNVTQSPNSITVQNSNVKTYEISPEILESIKESLIHHFKTNPDFLQEIMNKALAQPEEVIELKSIDKNDAKKLIQEYTESNPGIKTSDIIINLKLDPIQVMEILKELQEEQILSGTNI